MSEQAQYHILIEGGFSQDWASWFDGLDVIPQEENRTLLSGCLADQTALHGVLLKLRDLGIPIIEIKRVEKGSNSFKSEG